MAIRRGPRRGTFCDLALRASTVLADRYGIVEHLGEGGTATLK